MSALPTFVGPALRSMRARPGRGVLLALTAALAVASMVSVRTLVEGQVEGVRADIARLGLRTVQVQPLPGPGGGGRLTAQDLETARIAVAPLGAIVLPAVVNLARVTDGGDARAPATPVLGTGHEYLETLDVPLLEGGFFTAEQAAAGDRVIVLDAALAQTLFPDAPAGGRTVRIDTGPAKGDYRVVGVLSDPLDKRAQVEALDRMDNVRSVTARLLSFRNAYVPRSAFPGDALSALLVVAPDQDAAARVASALETALDARARKLFVWSRGEWVASLSDLMRRQSALGDIVWAVIVLVAVVTAGTLALVVSADRTAEVGVRRAEGATRGDVLGQFLVEGSLQALAGGAAGIVAGSAVGHWLAASTGLHASTEGSTVLQALVLAVAVGAAASTAPALRAASLRPADALRGGGT